MSFKFSSVQFYRSVVCTRLWGKGAQLWY